MLSLCLRIASTLDGYNGHIYVAGQLFIATMEVVMIFANLAFAHQIIRSQHGGGIISTLVFLVVYFLMFLAWAMQLAGLGQTFFTLDFYTRDFDYNFQIWATTFYAFASLLPVGFVFLSCLTPKRKRRGGAGLYLSAWILIAGSLLVALQAWYIAAVFWIGRTNRFLPLPDFMSRAWYYFIIWTIDIIVVFLYIFARVDRRPSSRDGNGNGNGAYPIGGAGPAGVGAYGGGPWAAGGVAPAPGQKKRRFGLGKLALGAGAAGAAGGGLLAMRRHRKNKKNEKEEMAREEQEDYSHNQPR
jgi:hypothetical protein